MDIGYGLNTDDIGNGSLLINPTVGFKYGAFSLGVGYYGSKGFNSGAKMMSAINIRLGYNFGYHRSTSPFANALRKLEFSIDFGARMPLGANTSGYTEDVKTLTTVWGETWNSYESKLSWQSKYSIAPDVTMALLYPVTEKFYVGAMAGLNLIINKSEAKDYTIYYSQPGVVKWEGTELSDHYDETTTQTSARVGLRMKYKVKEITLAKRFYPFAQLDLGYDINWSSDPGFFYSPAVGISMDVAGGRHSVDLGVSYVTQKVEDRHFVRYDNHNDWEYDYKNAGALRISLGYTF